MDNPFSISSGNPYRSGASGQPGGGNYTGWGPGFDFGDIIHYGGRAYDIVTGDPGGDTGPIDSLLPGNGGPSTNGKVPGRGHVPGCSVTLPVQMTQRVARAPRGYVTVYPDDPSGRTGAPVYMLKTVARTCGLWKSPAKPPIKASDWNCLKKANRTVKKLDRVVKMANQVTGKADYRRTRRSR